MTTFHEDYKECKLCGNISQHFVLGSTNTFGPTDLDARPAEMERSTMDKWVQICPECGYCYNDISKGKKKYQKVVQSENYQEQLENPKFPELANAFICQSHILECDGKYEAAAWACINAAWACDDVENAFGAQFCRHMALGWLQSAVDSGEEVFNNPRGSFDALNVDLLRRGGLFERAMEVCDKGLKNQPEQIITEILNFQKTLIQREDTGCYTLGDVSD